MSLRSVGLERAPRGGLATALPGMRICFWQALPGQAS